VQCTIAKERAVAMIGQHGKQKNTQNKNQSERGYVVLHTTRRRGPWNLGRVGCRFL
jgi:hypothetical protein